LWWFERGEREERKKGRLRREDGDRKNQGNEPGTKKERAYDRIG
jgi:hypothetical protein